MRMTDFPILAEIKAEYIRYRRDGYNRTDATEMLLDSYKNELQQGAEDDGLLIWIGLADAQFYRKELSLEVAEKATAAADKLLSYPWQVCPGDLERRKANYAKAPMSEKGVGKPRPPFRCPWEIGDTFAYVIAGSEAEEQGIAGQYALLRKVDDIVFSNSTILPVMTVSMWEKKPFPTTTEEFLTVPLLKLKTGGRCFSPKDKFEYRVELLIHNKKQLNSLPLEYVGNFADVPMPQDEIVFTNAGEMLMASPNQLTNDLCIFYKTNKKIQSGERIGSATDSVGGFLEFLCSMAKYTQQFPPEEQEKATSEFIEKPINESK